MLPAMAAAADAAPSERRLTDAQVQNILDAAAKRGSVAPALSDTDARISGEIGFGLGTGGYRSIFGSGYVPLGDGFASFSFDSEISQRSGAERADWVNSIIR